MPNPRRTKASEVALAQVSTFGLTTVRVLSKTRFGGETHGARLTLGRLVTEGKLHRHLCRYSGSADRFAYFTASDKPLRLDTLRRAYAIACHCLIRETPVEPLSDGAFHEMLDPIAKAVGVEAVRFTACYPDSSPAGERLVLVRPLPLDSLDRVLVSLQDWSQMSEFALWGAFIQEERLSIKLLVPGKARAAEMGRWLGRRPVLIRTRHGMKPVPFMTEPMARIK